MPPSVQQQKLPQPEKRSAARFEILIVALVFVIVNLLGYFFQAQISSNGGKGFDGCRYYTMAEQISADSFPLREYAPFVYRIGTPFLASLFGADLILGFKLVNIGFNVLSVLLLLYWFRLFLRDWRVRTAMLVLFMTHWLSPVRFVHFSPVYADPAFFVFLTGGLIVLHKLAADQSRKNVAVLSLICFFGVLFRQETIFLAFAALAIDKPGFRKIPGQSTFVRMPQLRLGVPLLTAAAGIAVGLMLGERTNAYYFPVIAVLWAWNKPLLSYVLAWFTSFGVLLALLLYDLRRTWGFLTSNRPLAVCLFLVAAVGWIGGTDTERILYWAAPGVYLLFGKAIEDNWGLLKRNRLAIWCLVFGYVLTHRMFLTMPDPEVTPQAWPQSLNVAAFVSALLSRVNCYHDQWSYFANWATRTLLLAGYMLFLLLFLVWMRARSKGNGARGMSDVAPRPGVTGTP